MRSWKSKRSEKGRDGKREAQYCAEASEKESQHSTATNSQKILPRTGLKGDTEVAKFLKVRDWCE